MLYHARSLSNNPIGVTSIVLIFVLLFIRLCGAADVAADSASLTKAGSSTPPTDTGTIAELDRMMVTASRYERLMSTAQSIALIKPEVWAGTGKSVADVVAEQTGVQTRTFGGRGSFQTVSIRGVEGAEVLVLLDGIPLNSAMGGAVDLGKINPLRLRGIEVFRGLIPGRFGGNGLGGVINLKSAQPAPDSGTGGDIAIMLGNYGTNEYSIAMSTSSDTTFSLFTQVLFERSDNTFSYLDRNNTFWGNVLDPTLDDTIRVMKNNQYISGGVLVHPVCRMSNGSTVYSNVNMTYAKAHQPANEGKVNHTAFYEEKVTRVSARLEPAERGSLSIIPAFGYLFRKSMRFSSSLDGGAGSSHATLSAPDSYTENGATEQSLSLPVTLHYRQENSVEIEAYLSGSGADINPVMNADNGVVGDWHSKEASVGGAVDITGYYRNLSLLAGGALRSLYSVTEGGLDGFTRKTVQPSDTVTMLWSVKGALSYGLLDSALSVYVNGGRFSNQPSLQQRYGARGAYNPNPTLRPEWGYSGELGVKCTIGRWYAELCGFYNRSYDKIITVFDGRQSAAINCSGARSYGVESLVNWSYTSLLRGESAITLQTTRNLAKEYNWYGRRLPNEPDLTIRESVTFTPHQRIALYYGISLKSFYYRTPANNRWADRIPKYEPGKKSDFWEIYHNVKGDWYVHKNCMVSLSAINLTASLFNGEHLITGSEGAYSWVLVPANQLYCTVHYSF